MSINSIIRRIFGSKNKMKLQWDILEDGWTSVRWLRLLDDKGVQIWRSKDHWHGINQTQFDEDFKFLVEQYGISENCKFNIQEIKTEGRVT